MMEQPSSDTRSEREETTVPNTMGNPGGNLQDMSDEVRNYAKDLLDIEGVRMVSEQEYATSPAEYKLRVQLSQRGRKGSVYMTETEEGYGLNVNIEDPEIGQAETWKRKILDNLEQE